MKVADDIIASVCADRGIGVEQLLQKGMYSRPIANARGEVIRRLRAKHFSIAWIARLLNMSTQGVSRHVYPNMREIQRLGGQRYRARKKAEATVQQ